MFEAGLIIALFVSAVRMAVPVIYGALGEVIAERTGVMNIGIEGQMLLGAFFSLVTVNHTGNLFLGVAAGALIGGAGAMVIAYLGVSRKQDQAVAGIMFNIFSLGFTSYMYRIFYGVGTSPPLIGTMKPVEIPLLSQIPVMGDILFKQNPLTYLAFLLALAVWFVLYRTKLGYELRAVGENPRAAQASGINVVKYRYGALAFSGMTAGLGGAFLSLAVVGQFMENISAGRGFIALSITILSRWNPAFALLGALGFGFVDALQLRLQAVGVNLPYQFMVMLPYVVTLLSIVFFGRNIHTPAALGAAYEKEGR